MSCSRTQHGGGRFRTPDLSLRSPTLYHWATALPYMLFLNEIISLAIPYHSSPIPMSMQCICKIVLKFVYSFLRYWPKMHFGHKSRVITVVSQWNYSSCNPIPLLSDTNVYAKFEENRSNGTKVKAQKRSDYGQTDERTDTQKFGGYNIIPRHFLCGGI